MGQRLVTLAAVVAVAAAATTGALGSSGRLPNWAAPQISTVVAHGLMARHVNRFRPNAPLTHQALATLTFDLEQTLTAPPPPPVTDPGSTTTGSTDPGSTTTGSTDSTTTGATTATAAATAGGSTTAGSTTTGSTTTGSTTAGSTTTGSTTTTTGTTTTGTTTLGPPPRVPDPSARTTMAELDRRLVFGLGLAGAAQEFVRGARAAGLRVPSRFGTETVARLLGLRTNHPASQDYLELRPQDTATRAEAAYSAAQILDFGWLEDSWQIQWVQSLADAFALPQTTPWQRRILDVAVSKIGMPYVWGGTSDGQEAPFGIPARGGYDCSGFVWRVYKLQRYPHEGGLASTIQGRTTYTMSVEVPRSERIGFDQLQPADVIFFGSRGPRSSGAEIDHTAIYLGNGWFIQSSGEGVALAQLDGWYHKQFAWGRRPLREAGLER